MVRFYLSQLDLRGAVLPDPITKSVPSLALIYPLEGFYECNECEIGYDKGKGNYCLDIDECYTVGCEDYDDGLELLCTNTEGLKPFKVSF